MIKRIIIKNYKGIKSADVSFNPEKNIFVGNNGVGKSTIIEALSLVLGYGYNQLEITPYLFHQPIKELDRNDLPEISIEVVFESEARLAAYSGKNNSLKEELLGIRLKICFDDAYKELLNEEYKRENNIIPCEYYKKERCWFSDAEVKQYNLPYSVHIIDSSSTYFNSRANKYISRLIQTQLSKDENVKIGTCLRNIKHNFESENNIKDINEKLNHKMHKVHSDLKVSIDLTGKSAWDTIMCLNYGDVPFGQIGLGDQCIIKTLLSLDEVIAKNKNQSTTQSKSIYIIEEPESHLSHTKMYELLGILNTNVEGQIIITTHNSFIANKLDLDNLILINNEDGIIHSNNWNKKDSKESKEMYNFFLKSSNYPTLRLALCNKAILVEGPTDEMVVTYYYKNKYNKHPFNDNIELIVVNGTAFKNFIALAKILKVKVAVITDNDSADSVTVGQKYIDSKNCDIKVFTEENIGLTTLEPSFINANLSEKQEFNLESKLSNSDNLKKLSELIRTQKKTNETINDLVKFMINNKTNWSSKLLESLDVENTEEPFKVPQYIVEAIAWICSQK